MYKPSPVGQWHFLSPLLAAINPVLRREDDWAPNVVSFSNCMKTCEKCSFWQVPPRGDSARYSLGD